MLLHWAEIVCELQKRGWTLTKVAEQESVSKSVVTEVIRGTKVSHPVAYAISSIIDIPTEKLWPGKYLTCPAKYKKLRGNSTRGRLPAKGAAESELRKAS